MPRTTTTNLKNHLQGETLTTTTCLLIIRKDGTKYGFTLLDSPITYTMSAPFNVHGSVTYTPVDSIIPTSIRSDTGSGVDGIEVDGIISDGVNITDDDLCVGLFEGAEVILFQVNFLALADKELIDYRGYVGEITVGNGMDKAYKAEFRSLTSLQKGYTGRVLNPTCRVARFCDTQCKLDEADFTYTASVVGTPSDSTHLTVGPNGSANDTFNFGILRITSGPNSTLEREIKLSVSGGGNQGLVLKEAFPWPLTNGITCEIIEGCDRLPTTCSVRYNNKINFRGEDLLPGTNKINQIIKPPTSTSTGN